MDVLPVVAKEVVACYHARMTAAAANATSSTTMAWAVRDETEQQANAAVTVELATLLTRLWLLGAKGTDAAGNVGDTAAHIEADVHDMVDLLCTRCSVAALSTLSLQSQSVVMQSTLRQKRATAEARHRAVAQRLLRALVERRAPAAVSPEEVIGDMTLYILHRYGQLQANSDASVPAHKETAMTLCGVLPRRQVVAFVRQDAVAKTRALDELCRVVWGMRLCSKEDDTSAGAGLVDVHSLLVDPLAQLQQQLADECARVHEQLRRLRAVLLSPTAPLTTALRQRLREEYHHALQLRHELLMLQCMHHTLAARAQTHLLPAYASALAAVRDAATAAAPPSSSTPSNNNSGNNSDDRDAAKTPSTMSSRRLAYPRYMALADAYQAIQKCSDELDDVRSMLQLCVRSATAYTTALPPQLADEATAAAAAVDARNATVALDRAALAARVTAALEAAAAATASSVLPAGARDDDDDDCAVAASLRDYHVSYTTDLPSTVDAVVAMHYPHLLCGLRGFCAVTYRRHGLLVPGRVDVHAPSFPGFVVVAGGRGRAALPRPLCCAFAGVDELLAFAAAPLAYVLPCVLRCNRAEPGVTVLLGQLDRLPRELYIAGARRVTQVSDDNNDNDNDNLDDRRDGSTRRRRVADASTQTTHPDPHHDHAYRWNEWDLRRQAIKLANLTHMRTHATQTAASHFRRDNAVQASPPREVGTQTMQDMAVQPPRVAQYIKGLRGSTTSKLEQVQRTFLY